MTLDSLVSVIGSMGCLLAASFLMCYSLVGMKFPDCRDKVVNEDRWKKNNTASRFGGTAIFILFVLVMNMWPDTSIKINNWVVLCGLFLLWVIGTKDDIQPVNWIKRLFFYMFMGMCMTKAYMSLNVPLTWIFPLILLFSINSFNMLDNMDLVSSLSACQMLVCVSIVSGDLRFAAFAVLLIPFMYFNGKGKLMMGDGGSTVLGAVFGLCAVWMLSNNVPWYSVVLIFGVPVMDTTFVLTRRLIERRPLWVGGVDHLTHVMARYLGPEVTVGMLTAMGFMLGGMGILLR